MGHIYGRGKVTDPRQKVKLRTKNCTNTEFTEIKWG